MDGFERVLEREDVRHLARGLVRAEGHDAVVENILLSLLQLGEKHSKLQNAFPTFDASSMTSEQKREHKSARCCHACRKPFEDTELKRKVHDHCHGTGLYRNAVRQECNLKMKQASRIPQRRTT
jgi:hypothetical protein